MRALAAIVFLVVYACCAHVNKTTHDPASIPYVLLSVLKTDSPMRRLIDCGQSLGLTKCVYALSAWRAKHASESFVKEKEVRLNLAADIEHFPWEEYNNSTNDELYSELCDGTDQLLRYRSLKFTLIPGYLFELESKGNGILTFDVYRRNDINSPRGSMKKFQKQFYNIVPYLLIPGLIMSAILPFVLPALKMMTVAVGMLNNMALSGAIFTLLRNNAFNDHYEKKVVYYNAGYKNEKHAPIQYDEELYHAGHEDFDIHSQFSGQQSDLIEQGDQFYKKDWDTGEDYSSNLDWIKQYYGVNDFIVAHKNRRNGQRKRRRRIKKRVNQN